MSFPDKVRNNCANISVTNLNKDDGLDTLINDLERLYVKDKKHQLILLMESLSHFKDLLKQTLLTTLMSLSNCTIRFNDTK